jgi:RNA polymerase sigma factor (sigma-70 family)
MNTPVEQFVNELRRFVPDLNEGVSDDGALRRLVKEQDDAILAAALRFGIFRNAIIEELLVVRHYARLTRMLRILGAKEDAAENLVQDLYVKVLKGALKDYDPNQEFRCYLQAIIRNLYRSSLRRRQSAFTEDMLDESPGPDTVDQEVEMHELLNQFEAAIKEFPELEQSIMWMTRDGIKPGDIANELGLEVSRIYPVLARCRKYLTELLAPTLPASSRGRPRLYRNTDSSCSGDSSDQS